jgi:hypothetical protein
MAVITEFGSLPEIGWFDTLNRSSTAIASRGIEEPIFGRLFETRCFTSGARLPHGAFANLAIEGELAIRLPSDLSSSPPSVEACRAAIESVFPVIELHDYVLRSPQPCCRELIANNGMHAGFVVAEQPHGGPLVHLQCMRILINDTRVADCEAPWTMHGPVSSLQCLSLRERVRVRVWAKPPTAQQNQRDCDRPPPH